MPATGAHVVLVGPGGEPHNLPSSFDGTTLRARFAPDRPGAFTVQVVADVATGTVAQMVLVRILEWQPSNASLVACRAFVRVVAGAVAVGSALPACALAAVYARRS